MWALARRSQRRYPVFTTEARGDLRHIAATLNKQLKGHRIPGLFVALGFFISGAEKRRMGGGETR
jgi:hypothetical protein